MRLIIHSAINSASHTPTSSVTRPVGHFSSREISHLITSSVSYFPTHQATRPLGHWHRRSITHVITYSASLSPTNSVTFATCQSHSKSITQSITTPASYALKRPVILPHSRHIISHSTSQSHGHSVAVSLCYFCNGCWNEVSSDTTSCTQCMQ
jgi:hypothetical protein